MLLAILFIFFQTGTTDLQILLTTEFSERRQIFLWIAFLREVPNNVQSSGKAKKLTHLFFYETASDLYL